jgi:hypothetical protein
MKPKLSPGSPALLEAGVPTADDLVIFAGDPRTAYNSLAY